MNSHRRAGANETFGRSHPHLARWFGDPEARAQAETELGRRHWIRTLFSGHLVAIAVLVVVSVAVWRAVSAAARGVSSVVSSVSDAVPDGGSFFVFAAAVGVVVVVVWLLRRWRDPVRRVRRVRVR